MAPNINNPGGTKNNSDEIRDGVVSDATRFPGGFIDEQITQAGAPVQIVGEFQLDQASIFQSFDVTPQDKFPETLAFNPDGNKLYHTGTITDNVYQYSLSTAYDVSTASFVRSFDVTPQVTSPQGLAFKPDGTEMYVTGFDNDNVQQYSLSTGFDISTASAVSSFDVTPQDGNPSAVTLKPDGSQLYVVGLNTSVVLQYSLSTAFDISTVSFSKSFDVSSQDTDPAGVTFKPDGTKMYVVGNEFENVNEYSLSTAFDISTASISQSFSVSGQDGAPQGLAFKPDGGRMYVVGRNNTNINQYSLSTAFDTSTASFVQARSVTKRTARPNGIAFKPDGSQLYVTGKSNATVLQYSVGVIGAELE